MIELKDYFLPYQIRWVRGGAAVAVAEKGRRIGWTYASAFRAVERRLLLGTDLFFSSADLTAAREFVEECQRWCRVFHTVAEDLGLRVIDERAGVTAFVLRFENGAKVVAGSSNPKFFRSKGGDADADEFAFHDQPRELYKAMQPAALIWGHQLRVWSTHNGEGSFFNRLVKSAGGGGQGSGFRGRDETGTPPGDDEGDSADAPPATGQPVRLHRVTLLDAVAQGLVERIRGLGAPDPAARRDFVEEIRASCPDEDAWNEEYLCRPSSEQSSLLSYDLIGGCETANLRLWDVGANARMEDRGSRIAGSLVDDVAPSSTLDPLSSSPGPLYAGFDVGRKHDRSVLWVLEPVGDVLWTRAVRVLEDATFTAQEDLLHLLLRNRSVRRLCVDATGIGAMLAERLRQRWGHRVEPVHFTAPAKCELAMPLVRLFQEKLIRIPADPAIREDLHKVRKVVTASHHVRLDADRDAGGHADRFWALALAQHAVDADGVRLPAPLLRKPVGW